MIQAKAAVSSVQPVPSRSVCEIGVRRRRAKSPRRSPSSSGSSRSPFNAEPEPGAARTSAGPYGPVIARRVAAVGRIGDDALERTAHRHVEIDALGRDRLG